MLCSLSSLANWVSDMSADQLPEKTSAPASQPSKTGSAIVQVRDVVTRFGSKIVHDGISLDIYKGEVFAIVGGSGSGKSTVMRQIVMLQPPTSGSIKVFGQEVSQMSELA